MTMKLNGELLTSRGEGRSHLQRWLTMGRQAAGSRVCRMGRGVGLGLMGMLLVSTLCGCSEGGMRPSVSRQVTEFEGTAQIGPAVDMGKVVEARTAAGPYRVGAGEVIELAMQGVIPATSTRDGGAPNALTTLDCRVGPRGSITLPLVGDVHVAGLTLSEVESAVAKAYYPAYTQAPPPVYAKIVEYKTFKASILGAVQKPGVYTLRSEQMSLVSLIMEAGGISERGATSIRIVHVQGSGTTPGVRPTRSGRCAFSRLTFRRAGGLYLPKPAVLRRRPGRRSGVQAAVGGLHGRTIDRDKGRSGPAARDPGPVE